MSWQAFSQMGSPLLTLWGAEKAEDASARAASMSMDFQREMSNTAHQREVTDLRKAGLNPILSSARSGASTPGGATFTGVDAGSATANSALAAVRNEADVKLLKRQEERTHQDMYTSKSQEVLNQEMDRLVRQQRETEKHRTTAAEAEASNRHEHRERREARRRD